MITVNSRQEFLQELKKHLPEKSIGIEIGVYEGDFSKMILDVINPASLILIDPYTINKKLYGESLNFLPTAYSTEDMYQNLIIRFYKDILSGVVSVVRKYSYEVVNFASDNIYDLIYHDASHLYEDVKRDLNEWLPKLKETGFMCLHDYMDFEGFGVKQATDEFIIEHNFDVIIYNQNGSDIALKRKQA